MAVLESIENLDGAAIQITQNITPDDYRELPEGLADAWEAAVLEINPNWRPGGAKPQGQGESS
jgi:hypothetical protein